MRIGLFFMAILLLAATEPVSAASPLTEQPGYDWEVTSPYSNVIQANAVRDELARLRERARRQGCNRGFFFQRRDRSCVALNRRIEQLTSFLHQPPRIQRYRGGTRKPKLSPPPDPPALYRTLCVRTCDGYFFPLNFSASRKRLKDEAKKCAAHYAEGQAVLFYHRNTVEDPATALNLNGQSYASRPYAFGHQKGYLPDCALQLQQGMQSLSRKARRHLSENAVTAIVNVPLPQPRPNPADDPETLANRAGKFTIGDGEPPIRVVGDRYSAPNGSVGPPETIDGYFPEKQPDFRRLLREAMLADRDTMTAK